MQAIELKDLLKFIKVAVFHGKLLSGTLHVPRQK